MSGPCPQAQSNLGWAFFFGPAGGLLMFDNVCQLLRQRTRPGLSQFNLAWDDSCSLNKAALDAKETAEETAEETGRIRGLREPNYAHTNRFGVTARSRSRLDPG